MQKKPGCLFVYGTLRQAFAVDAAVFLRQNADYIGTAYTHGKLYEVDRYPGLVLSQNPMDKVWGEYYRLDNDGMGLLPFLDQYEGCSPVPAVEDEYFRSVITIYDQRGERYDSWAYVYNRPVSALCAICGGDYMNYRKSPADSDYQVFPETDDM